MKDEKTNGMLIEKESPHDSEKKFSSFGFLRHQFSLDCAGIEKGSHLRESDDQSPEQWHSLLYLAVPLSRLNSYTNPLALCDWLKMFILEFVNNRTRDS
jgi:hypothetical protein